MKKTASTILDIILTQHSSNLLMQNWHPVSERFNKSNHRADGDFTYRSGCPTHPFDDWEKTRRLIRNILSYLSIGMLYHP